METGQFVQDAQSMPFGGPQEDDYINRFPHDGLLTIHDQVTEQKLRRAPKSMAARPLSLAGVALVLGSAHGQQGINSYASDPAEAVFGREYHVPPRVTLVRHCQVDRCR